MSTYWAHAPDKQRSASYVRVEDAVHPSYFFA